MRRTDERVLDDQQRLRPGVVAGWGMSWWFAEQGVARADRKAIAARPVARAARALLARSRRRLVAGGAALGLGGAGPPVQERDNARDRRPLGEPPPAL
jgi:hypothetical protein